VTNNIFKVRSSLQFLSVVLSRRNRAKHFSRCRRFFGFLSWRRRRIKKKHLYTQLERVSAGGFFSFFTLKKKLKAYPIPPPPFCGGGTLQQQIFIYFLLPVCVCVLCVCVVPTVVICFDQNKRKKN
jgi:hypothetical protein